MRHERYYRDDDGLMQVEVIEQDDRTIQQARREKMAMVWEQARRALTDRLGNRGYDQRSATALAAVLLFQQLPAAERSALASLADSVAAAAMQRIQAINAAETNEDVDAVDP